MSKHVIFSRAANNGPLTQERIAQLAPAVYSTTKAGRLTDRYVSLHTSDIIPVLADYGYEPVQAAQKRSRMVDAVDHASHMVAFAKPATDDESAGIRPEIILYNSHDGTGSVKLFAGCFRFICSNGIIAGNGFQSRVYHSKALSGFEDMLRKTVDTLPTLMERMERLRGITLTIDDAYDIAQRGVATRWDMFDGQTKGVFATQTTVNNVLQPQRVQDNMMDAFTVFNRIQEGVIRGNAFVKSLNATHPEGHMRKARNVSSIKEHVRINAELWDIADAIAA
ncbi:Protein of unknown function DUF932 [uncultured Caudovirales phage]|uniref:DUF945 domain-containing protein n=1 Tax=uncultured Caudovirales phage TaxID=2100421 RepID=A0A6J5QHW6_9CAUD|nr:Protein of unknown function DUF932 [uncultured Caudovirales phage]CAB4181011.1 Protein of unknown function DUF932 [uncultured Caudovirales phage]